MKKINLKELSGLLKTEFPNIKFAYIFGSGANGEINDGSDIDVAVYFSENYNKMQVFEIASKLEDYYKVNIDVVLLNTANSIIKHEIIKKGRLLFEFSETQRIAFEINSFKDYVDNSFFMRRRYAG